MLLQDQGGLGGGGDASGEGQTVSTAIQQDAVEVVIRIAASLKSTGIVTDANGVILSSPGGLFDSDYTVIGINGKRYVAGMETQVPR